MRNVLLLITLLLSTSSFGQKKAFINRSASFPGGEDSMHAFVRRLLRYPEMASENDIQGRVRVRFVIDEQGNCSQIKVIKGILPVCDSEAVRIVRTMPKWTPALYKNKPVKSVFELPVVFLFEWTR